MNTNYMQAHGIDQPGSARFDIAPEARNDLPANAKLHIKYVLPIAWSATEAMPSAASIATTSIPRR